MHYGGSHGHAHGPFELIINTPSTSNPIPPKMKTPSASCSYLVRSAMKPQLRAPPRPTTPTKPRQCQHSAIAIPTRQSHDKRMPHTHSMWQIVILLSKSTDGLKHPEGSTMSTSNTLAPDAHTPAVRVPRPRAQGPLCRRGRGKGPISLWFSHRGLILWCFNSMVVAQERMDDRLCP